MLTVRASSLPVLSRCAAASQAPEVVIDGAGDEARLGSAVHQVAAAWLHGGPQDETVTVAAAEWGVDREEVESLAWRWRRLWDAMLAPHFPEPQTEVELTGFLITAGGQEIRLTGHADVLSVDGNTVRVADGKTGRVDESHEEQLKAYAWLALQQHPECDSAYSALLRVRDGLVDGEVYARVVLDAWAARLAEHLATPETYNPGPWCGHCKRAHECPARREQLRTALVSLMGSNRADVTPLPDASAGPIYAALLDNVKAVEAACATARELVKADVQARGGSLPTGDGRELVIEQQERRAIDLVPALPVLRACEQIVDERQIFAHCDLSKKDLERIVRDNSAPRQGSKNVRELYARLEEAGAIITTYQDRLEVRRSVATIGVQHGDSSNNGAV